MVVNHVQGYRQTCGMTSINEGLKPIRPAVSGMRRVQIDTVVAPVICTGKLGYRHELDCGHAEFML